jgi:uncharacterized membrane protein YbaN (DUF454 family)
LPEQKACPNPAVKPKKNRAVRALLIIAGTVSLVFAAIGLVLPLLPTTPFLLLAVACYCRSSERLYTWLINNKWFGAYIKNYREGKGIPLKTKVFAVTVLWVTISISALVLVPILIVQVVLLVIAIAVTIHILRLPTYRKKPFQKETRV